MSSNHVAVVGGGLAGLASSIYLARAGKQVTLFERSKYLGGRAVTRVQDGFRFNLGPHALYNGGAGRKVLRELSIPLFGNKPSSRGMAEKKGTLHRLPANLIDLAATSLLGSRAKLATLKLLAVLPRLKLSGLHDVSVSSWLAERVEQEEVRELFEALLRLTTYCDDPEQQSAAAALLQLQLVLRRGVLYVDEGWQTIVDGLRGAAISSGVNFVTSSHVVGIEHDGRVRAIRLGELDPLSMELESEPAENPEKASTGGAIVPVDAVILAVPPAVAVRIVGTGSSPSLERAVGRMSPVLVASLDLALRKLPRPDLKFTLGIDRPLYYSVHSAYARLAPAGSATVHVVKYLRQEQNGKAEAELESLLDQLQPGWREQVVHKRFFPRLTVTHALVEARHGGLNGRPAVAVPEIENLYLSGDWVGGTGMLSDASFASAREAARAIAADSDLARRSSL